MQAVNLSDYLDGQHATTNLNPRRGTVTTSISPRHGTLPDHAAPMARLSRLLDPDSAMVLHEPDSSGAVAVRGRVHGTAVYAYCTDATRLGGAIGAHAADHIIHAIDAALRDRCPVIGVWHSGGARLADGVESLDGMSRMFAAMTRASGRIPQLSLVVGPAAGAAAYGPALTDIVIMSEEGRMFVTGPAVVRSVTGEDIDMERLGGHKVHTKSGVAHMMVDSEGSAYEKTRIVIDLLARPGFFDLSAVSPDSNLADLLPRSSRRAYDVRPLIHRILDSDGCGTAPVRSSGFEELQPQWAPNLVVGFGRLSGGTVGVVANNPLRVGGCLDSLGAEKAARFVRTCDALGVPLLVLVDVPGYLPGARQEWEGIVRRGAKLLHAFAEAEVPRATLITRKAYGGAYVAMNSRGLGATAVFAWPDAEVAVMGADAAVDLLHRRELASATEAERPALRARLTAEHVAHAGGVHRAEALGLVDEVIPPALTRLKLAHALAGAPVRRGQHGNIPL